MLNDITDYIIPSDSNILASTKSKAISGPYKTTKAFISWPFFILAEALFLFLSLKAGNL